MIYRYFVTGTDTSAGKTIVSAALLQKAAQQGFASFGLKPIAAGCIGTPATNADALLLQRHSAIQLAYSQHNPVALNAAIAPHIAAQQQQKSHELELNNLTARCTQSLTHAIEADDDNRDSWQLIEGAGGWMVPLNNQNTLADLAVQLSAPVILVVGIRLGCINHALLSVQSIRATGLKVAGWVANSLEARMPSEQSNLDYLTQAMQNARIPLLGHIPYHPELSLPDGETEHNLPDAAVIEAVARSLKLPI